jgi:hypothetical protein
MDALIRAQAEARRKLRAQLLRGLFGPPQPESPEGMGEPLPGPGPQSPPDDLSEPTLDDHMRAAALRR